MECEWEVLLESIVLEIECVVYLVWKIEGKGVGDWVDDNEFVFDVRWIGFCLINWVSCRVEIYFNVVDDVFDNYLREVEGENLENGFNSVVNYI